MSFIRREANVWGLLRFLRTALAEATERLSQWSVEAADLRLLCDELGVEAAAARAEAQRRQLELGQVIGECNALNLGVEFFFFFSLTKFRRYPFLFPFLLAKP